MECHLNISLVPFGYSTGELSKLEMIVNAISEVFDCDANHDLLDFDERLDMQALLDVSKDYPNTDFSVEVYPVEKDIIPSVIYLNNGKHYIEKMVMYFPELDKSKLK